MTTKIDHILCAEVCRGEMFFVHAVIADLVHIHSMP